MYTHYTPPRHPPRDHQRTVPLDVAAGGDTVSTGHSAKRPNWPCPRTQPKPVQTARPCRPACQNCLFWPPRPVVFSIVLSQTGYAGQYGTPEVVMLLGRGFPGRVAEPRGVYSPASRRGTGKPAPLCKAVLDFPHMRAVSLRALAAELRKPQHFWPPEREGHAMEGPLGPDRPRLAIWRPSSVPCS